MKIYQEELADVDRYLQNNAHLTLEDHRPHYHRYLRPLRKYVNIDSGTNMLEVGTGTGWFPTLCKMDGLQCRGLEISPQLIEYARKTAAPYGIEPDIHLGNLEDFDIGDSVYDVIVCSNVFEHVEYWRTGVSKIYRALKPGGAMFFESTNKFSPVSGEYSEFPLYGWLPNRMRYNLRIAVAGPDIMKLGIDFHQFTHGMLRKEFKKTGFSKIFDRVEIAEEAAVSSELRKLAVRWSRQSSLIKALALTFAEATRFICIR